MTARHARAGEIIRLMDSDREPKSGTLIRESHTEVFRLVLPQGKHLAEHQAAGAITIQCLCGAVDLIAGGKIQLLSAGDIVYLGDHQPHAVTAIEDSVLLISMWLNRA